MTHLLAQREYWDKKTGKPNRAGLIKTYTGIRENWFMNEVYWPRMLRCADRLISLGFPKECFKEVTLGEDEQKYMWPSSPLLCEEIENRLHDSVGLIWDNEEWGYEEPSIKELLELGITPSIIEEKVYKKDSHSVGIQPGLF